MDESKTIKVPQYIKSDPAKFNPKAMVGFTLFGALAGMLAYAWTSRVEGRIFKIVNDDLRYEFTQGDWEQA